MPSAQPEPEQAPKIRRTRMGPVQRVVLGIVCALVSVGIFFAILMILERFKQNAPGWIKIQERAAQLRRAGRGPGGRRAAGKR